METELTFIEKVADVQAKLNVPKTKNSKVPYASRSAEQILEAAVPLLANHGLVITIDDELIAMEGRLFIKSTATIVQGESEGISGTAMAELMPANNMMNAAQASGATTSYAHKYALGSVLAIGEGEDADHEKYKPNQSDPEFHTTYMDGPAKVLSGVATEKQISLIEMRRNGMKAGNPQAYDEFKSWYLEKYGQRPLKELSKADASLIIDRLNDKGE